MSLSSIKHEDLNIFHSKEAKLEQQSDSGSILLELIIAVPFLIFLSFMGYELTKSSLNRLVLNDLAREFAISSFQCTSKPDDARENCIREVVNELSLIANEYFPADPDKDILPVQFAIQRYRILEETDDSGNSSADDRADACLNGEIEQKAIKNLGISREISLIPSDFPLKYKLNRRVRPTKGSRGNRPFNTVNMLFNENPELTENYREIFCLNGSITIAEAYVEDEPLLKFNIGVLGVGAKNDHVEDTNTRRRYHAAVIL